MKNNLVLNFDDILDYKFSNEGNKPKVRKTVKKVKKLTPSQRLIRARKIVFEVIRQLTPDEIRSIGFKGRAQLKQFIRDHELIADYQKPRFANPYDFLEYVGREHKIYKKELKDTRIEKGLKQLNDFDPEIIELDEIEIEPLVFDPKYYQTKGKFKSTVQNYQIKSLNYSENQIKEPLYTDFLDRVHNKVVKLLKHSIMKNNNVKYTLRLVVKIIQGNDPETIKLWSFNTYGDRALTVYKSSNFTNLVDEGYERIINKIEAFTNNGSNWRVLYPLFIDVETYKYNPSKIGSYIELPQNIKNKGACVNVRNKDDACFKWCILAHLYGKKDHADRIKQYEKINHGLNFNGLNFPVKDRDINIFERNNKDFSIHVTAIDERGKLYPFRPFSNLEAKNKIYLLMISNDETHHYVLIRSLKRLVGTYNGNSHEVCDNCFTTYSTVSALEKHKKNGCLDNKPILPELPKPEEAYVKFKAINKQLKKPFVIYADFESVIVDNQHIACSYGYQIVSEFPEHNKPYKMYRGENAVKLFLDDLLNEEKWIMPIVNRNYDMIMTDEDNETYKNSTKCHICTKDLNNDKVRDHDHLTGKFRGAAHYNCNINYNFKNYKIPIFFHNLRGYDSHLIMQDIGKLGLDIDVIANTNEKYITFSVSNLQFIDTFQHLPSSLDSLSESLIKANDKKMFPNLLNQFKDISDEQYNYIIQKGIYPYSFMDSFDKFNLNKLPPKSAFYNDLREEEIKDSEYERANTVWNLFNCKNMGDYHDLYLKTDVCILADVFENWRNICLKFYGLDPAYYFTSPSLSWDALLKMTDRKIEVFNNEQYDMLLMVEKAKRGGMCMVTKRHSKANNKYLKNYDQNKPSKYISYLDANNLYGWAMSQILPVGQYRFVSVFQYTVDKLLQLNESGKTGYIFEVDLEYPNELHDLHNDYPLAPENIEGIYSDYMNEMVEKMESKKESSSKLIPNLLKKEKYVVHYRLLQLYVKLGMKITKFHRILAFAQDAWMKPYIDFNTEQRKIVKTDFEKDIFKLMNNSVYGKTCENVRNRINVKLVTTEEKYNKYVRLPTFINGPIFNDDLMAVNNGKPIIKFDKPVITGICVLDLSKLLMYNFHYNTMLKNYGDKCKMIYTDTDSLIYEVETDDLYEDMLKIQDNFDCSEYPKDHILYNPINKKVIGKFKDEVASGVISEFIALRPKLYSYLVEGEDKKHIKCKGVAKSFVKHHIRHETLKEVLYGTTKEECFQYAKFKCIRSTEHKINTIEVNKISLNPFDNKRFWKNNVDSYALGHHKTLKSQ